MKKLIFLLILSTGAFSDVSLYRGFGTTHLFMDNEYLNNNNGVTAIMVGDVALGAMTNSFGEDGYFVGYQPKVKDGAYIDVYAGLAVVTGYRRWQLLYVNYDEMNYNEKVVVYMPIISASYALNEHIELQVNNMALFVLNAGIRVNF